jgi:CofD-related protein of GAK system
MSTVRVSRGATVPDPLRVARCLRAPELGPRILFFSGGSALRDLSRTLTAYTHNSIHLITPFDSGGSSAVLRRAFDMLSVGDLRNRLMALADQTVRGNPEIYRLFAHRLPPTASGDALAGELRAMVAGTHPLVEAIPSPMRRLVRVHLRLFQEAMTADFDLAGASIGNLILAGGYLHNDRDIDSVIYLFTRLVEARGTVFPVVDAALDLAAELADGSVVTGQHRLTGKQVAPLTAAVRRLSLVRGVDDATPAGVRLHRKVERLIESADLICFPMGSFYSSVVANLLPAGVGRAVAAARCPRVYIPNTGRDPEQLGMGIEDAIDRIIEHVRADLERDGAEGWAGSGNGALDLVLLDSRRGAYSVAPDETRLRRRGVDLVDVPLAAADGSPRLDARAVAEALVSLV